MMVCVCDGCAGSAVEEVAVLHKALEASRGDTKDATLKLQEAKRDLAR